MTSLLYRLCNCNILIERSLFDKTEHVVLFLFHKIIIVINIQRLVVAIGVCQ